MSILSQLDRVEVHFEEFFHLNPFFLFYCFRLGISFILFLKKTFSNIPIKMTGTLEKNRLYDASVHCSNKDVPLNPAKG